MPIQHVVQAGESTISLSEQYGFFAGTIWDDPANAELRQSRSDMNSLMPGDVIVIPDKQPKTLRGATDLRHVYRHRGVPAVFRLQLLDNGAPRANQPFQMVVDGTPFTGTTDATGTLQVYLSPLARKGTLTVGDDYSLALDFGGLNPIEEVSGVQMRLRNLGFGPDEVTYNLDDATQGRPGELPARGRPPPDRRG
ncbi:MAG TPA: hypothetical protein VEX86_00950 [Longimicrobium sp.]|nr:hypothetical protein [Longimicrobium sp.]